MKLTIKTGRISQRIDEALDKRLKEASKTTGIKRAEIFRTEVSSFLDALKKVTPDA